MKEWRTILKNLSLLSQLGLSLITPLLLCLFLCYLLVSRLNVGEWVYIPGFFFGMGGSVSVAWKFWKMVERDQEKDRDKKRRGENGSFFNEHQ